MSVGYLRSGTWTPIIGGSGGTSGQTYSATQAGTYVRVGPLVVASYSVRLSVKGTITGNVEIQGLPFGVEATVGSNICGFASLAISRVLLTAVPLAGGTSAQLQGLTAAATSFGTLTTSDIANNTLINGTIIFTTTDA